MRIRLLSASLAIAMISAISPASAEQRDFPTGEPGANVTYLDAAGPGHPTACVVSVGAGLPALGFSFALFSNNMFTITVASQQYIPNVVSGTDATIKLNSTYIFSKVTSSSTSGYFHSVVLAPVASTPIAVAYEAIHEIVVNGARVDVVADDAQLPGVNIPAEPRLAAALNACQQYLITH